MFSGEETDNKSFSESGSISSKSLPSSESQENVRTKISPETEEQDS